MLQQQLWVFNSCLATPILLPRETLEGEQHYQHPTRERYLRLAMLFDTAILFKRSPNPPLLGSAPPRGRSFRNVPRKGTTFARRSSSRGQNFLDVPRGGTTSAPRGSSPRPKLSKRPTREHDFEHFALATMIAIHKGLADLPRENLAVLCAAAQLFRTSHAKALLWRAETLRRSQNFQDVPRESATFAPRGSSPRPKFSRRPTRERDFGHFALAKLRAFPSKFSRRPTRERNFEAGGPLRDSRGAAAAG